MSVLLLVLACMGVVLVGALALALMMAAGLVFVAAACAAAGRCVR